VGTPLRNCEGAKLTHLNRSFPLPKSKFGQSPHESCDVLLGSQRDHAIVERVRNPSFGGQWYRGFDKGDELAVRECIGDEIARRRLLEQIRHSRCAGQQRDCIVKHRWAPSVISSASTRLPSSAFSPVTFGATTSHTAPSFTIAAFRAVSRLASTPSVTRMLACAPRTAAARF